MKTILLTFLLIIVTGCVSIQKGDFKYFRVGNQDVKDMRVYYLETPEGVEIDAQVAQASSESEIKGLLEQVVEMLKEIRGN